MMLQQNIDPKSNLYRIALSMLVIFGLCLPATAGTEKDKPPPASFDGMELIMHTRSSIHYRKADVEFAGYDKLILLPCQVAFKKNWQRDYNRSRTSANTRVTERDMTRIKDQVAKLFNEVFSEELKKTKNFSLTSKPGARVLLLKPAIINLDVNAPDLKSAHRQKTYVQRTGEGTLYLEVFDSVSGEILARVIDAKATREHSFFQWATRVSNRADTKALLGQWAKKLRQKLDEVHDH